MILSTYLTTSTGISTLFSITFGPCISIMVNLDLHSSTEILIFLFSSLKKLSSPSSSRILRSSTITFSLTTSNGTSTLFSTIFSITCGPLDINSSICLFSLEISLSKNDLSWFALRLTLSV